MNRFLYQSRSYRLAELLRFAGDGFAFFGAIKLIAKIVLRNVRQDANSEIKKLELPEDEEKRGTNEVQELINKYNKIVEDINDEKEKELMTV